ncbi:DeoR C terminal sensor domain-containing protein [Roseicitreum antarcticum]|uniref:DeoR C terminal sensor domain-containing protein n=2 Tax=Roseicitreum antarcticum TaxID=564137 RepID=A0A1H2TG18_9RHOB|nr:DeoR C terminal sensor domain-containing protein [Roseicitreum antarcticum]
MNAVASRLSPEFSGLIVTPAPSVALAALARGAHVHLIGGSLCPEGAMATGGDAERFIGTIAADLCLLGACGLWPDFGLSAEDAGEAGVKRAMAHASARAVVVASAAKLMRRGRHLVLDLDEIDGIVTDASSAQMAPFLEAEIEVIHV